MIFKKGRRKTGGQTESVFKKEGERETDRQTDREWCLKGREKERWTDRKRVVFKREGERETDRQKESGV